MSRLFSKQLCLGWRPLFVPVGGRCSLVLSLISLWKYFLFDSLEPSPAMKHWTEEEERALLCIVQEKNLLGAIDGRRARNSQVRIWETIGWKIKTSSYNTAHFVALCAWSSIGVLQWGLWKKLVAIFTYNKIINYFLKISHNIYHSVYFFCQICQLNFCLCCIEQRKWVKTMLMSGQSIYCLRVWWKCHFLTLGSKLNKFHTILLQMVYQSRNLFLWIFA